MSEKEIQGQHRTLYYNYTLCYQTDQLQRNLKYQGIKVLNSIPFEIQRLPKQAFKGKLKQFFVQSYS